MHYAITGGIASGKSWFCDKLKRRGFTVYSCDEAAKRIIRNDEEVRWELQKLVGNELYDGDGKLQKAVLARYLTSSTTYAEAVNRIVHPHVAEDYLQWRSTETTPHTFMECALLYECGWDKFVDSTILVYAPDALRLRRLMHRDGITAEQAQRWLNLQMPEDEKRRRADIVVYNTKDNA